MTIVELAERVGLCASRSEARRKIKEGGLSVNNVKVTDENAVLTREQLLARGSQCCASASGSWAPFVSTAL